MYNIELDHLKVSNYGTTLEYNLERSTTLWVDAMEEYLSRITPFNIALGLSGGADSEAIATILHRMGRPFTPLIFDYLGKNKHDTDYAIAWCEANGYYPRVIPMDPLGLWVENQDVALALAAKTQCVSPQYLVYMNIMESMQPFGSPVLCIGEPELEYSGQAGDNITLIEKPMHFVAEIYRRQMSIDGNCLPFQTDKSVMEAWISDPYWLNLAPGQSSKELKADFYNHYLGIEKRVKKDGFENLRDEDKVLRDQLVALYSDNNSIIRTDISL
jgi:hypothetical protein